MVYKFFVLENDVVVNCILATQEWVDSDTSGLVYIRCDLANSSLVWEGLPPVPREE